MNRCHLLLLVGLVPILVAAQLCLHHRVARVCDTVVVHDGTIDLLFFKDVRRAELWKTSQNSKLRAPLGSKAVSDTASLTSNLAGDRIIVASSDDICAIDADSGATIWSRPSARCLSQHCEFVHDEKWLLVVNDPGLSGGYRYQESVSVAVLDPESGETVFDFCGDDVQRQVWAKDWFAYRIKSAGNGGVAWKVYTISDDGPKYVESWKTKPVRWNSNRYETEYDTLGKRLPFEAHHERADSPESLRPRIPSSYAADYVQLSMIDSSQRQWLIGALSIAVPLWVWLLIHDGRRSTWDDRYLLDLCIVGIVIVLVSVRWNDWALRLPTNQNFVFLFGGFYNRGVAVLCSMAVVAFFGFAMKRANRVGQWSAFLFACAFPMLAGVVLASLSLYRSGFRFNRSNESWMTGETDHQETEDTASSGKLRFEIGHLLLLTFGAAVFIAMAQYSTSLLLAGFAFSIWFVASAFSGSQITLVITTAILALIGSSGDMAGVPPATMFLLTIPACFAVLTCHGYRLRMV